MEGNSNDLERLEMFLNQHEPNEHDELRQFYEGFYVTPESVKILADACRNPDWRSPLAHAGFLSLIRNLPSAMPDYDVSKQILRFVANCCADNNESRDLILNDLDKLSACLQDDHLFDFAVVALNNVCNEYDPTQDAALRHNVHGALAAALRSKSLDIENQPISIAAMLLVSLVYQAVSTAKLEYVLTVSFIGNILVLPLKYRNWDMYAELLEMLVMLFQDTETQRWIAQRGSMVDILKILEDAYERMDHSTKVDVADKSNDENHEEISKSLAKYIDEICTALCAVVGTPEYRNEKMRDSHFTAHMLEKWLAEWDSEWKMHTAALLLGNMTQSDEMAVTLVNDFELNHTVTGAIKRTNDKQVLYACGVLLRNLVIPEKHAIVRASAEAFIAARRLMLHDDHDKRLFISGLRLLRQCIRDFGACQLLILKSPAEPKLSLHTLTDFLDRDVEGDANLKVEVGRATVMMFKTLNRSKCPTVPNLLHILNKEQRLIDTMVELVVLGTDTHLEGEGWFGLALASRTEGGAKAVYKALKDRESVESLIKRVRSEGCSNGGENIGKAKENAKVLAATLVNVIPEELEEDHLKSMKQAKEP